MQRATRRGSSGMSARARGSSGQCVAPPAAPVLELALRNKHAMARVKGTARSLRAACLALAFFAAAVCGCRKAPDAAGKPIAFIDDDYPRARAEARARGVPLLVDAWAPWCHTCMSMRAYVFPDPALRRFASQFEWLALDTEREANAPFVTKLGVRVLPTLSVVNPWTEEVTLAWPGSLTARELGALLDEALIAAGGAGKKTKAEAALRRGHLARAEGRLLEAVGEYRVALGTSPMSWPARHETLDALVTSLGDAQQRDDCAATAAEAAPSMPPGTALADVLRSGLSCATDAASGEAAHGKVAELTALGERVANDSAQPILADDRSDLFQYVLSGWNYLDRGADAERVAQAWAAFLEGEARRAPSPSARAVFDPHRLAAYIALGQPERAVGMLEQSAHDFPADYNPPARLGAALFAMKRYDDAAASLSRALTLAYGPRKLRLWSTLADVMLAKGDRDSAIHSLQSALDFARAEPLPGRYPELRDAMAKRLEGLRGGSATSPEGP
jgi:tetratricopeptide (TPR) repeat protein